MLIALTGAVLVPLACGDQGECSGPQGLCVPAPSASAGTSAIGGGSSLGGAHSATGGNLAGEAGSPASAGESSAAGGLDAGAPNGGGVTISFPGGGSAGAGGSATAGTSAGAVGGGGLLGGTGGVSGAGYGGGGAGSGGGTGPVVPGWALCPPQSGFLDTCGGAAGAAGAEPDDPSALYCGPVLPAFAGNNNEPASAGGGAGAPPGETRTVTLIDDFEHTGRYADFLFNGRGGWGTASSTPGSIFPAPCFVSSQVDPNDASSGHANHFFGAGFPATGFAQVLLAMRTAAPDCAQPTDASSQTGIRFRARATPGSTTGSAWVRVAVQTSAIMPVTNNGVPYFGTCTSGCFDAHGSYVLLSEEWAEYFVPFASLVQQGWGTPVTFDRATVLGLTWTPQADRQGNMTACFDFWIDDLGFYQDR